MQKEYNVLKPFLERAYLLDDGQLKNISKKDNIQDQIYLLQKYLNIDDFRNPFDAIPLESPVQIGEAALRVMRNPDNFAFTCKVLFNLDLMPFQQVILKQLWTKTFPILLATRGGGKSYLLAVYTMLRALFNQGCKVAIVGAGFRQSKAIFEYMEKLWYTGDVYRDLVNSHNNSSGREQGPRRSVDRCDMVVGDSIAFCLPLGDGCVSPYTLTTYEDCFGTISDDILNSNHKIVKRNRLIWGKGKFRNSDEAYYNGLKPTKIIKTKIGLQIEGTHNHAIKIVRDDKIVWCRFDEMQIGDRVLVDKTERWHRGKIDASLEACYSLGLMIGDGCWTRPYKLCYATQDKELSDALIFGTGFNFKQHKTDPAHFSFSSKPLKTKWMEFWGLKKAYSYQKELPPTILKASKDQMAACISGIFDTDGTLQVSTAKGGTAVTVSLANTSEKLIDQLQYILLHYGIVSTKTGRVRNVKHHKAYELLISGKNAVKFQKEINFKLSRKREKLESGINDKIKELSFNDSVPIDMNGLLLNTQENWKSSRMNEKTSIHRIKRLKSITKNFLKKYLSHYPSNNFTKKIKLLLNENIYYDVVTEIKDSCCETYDVHVPEDNEYCANGFFSHNSRIRGQRANFLLADEISSINEDIFNDVVFGFASVSSAPAEKAKQFSQIQLLKSLNMWTAENQRIFQESSRGNQVVLSGTADYTFGHFYKTFKLYRDVIRSQDNPQRLKEILGEKTETGMSSKDCSIIRLPATVLPKGFMDEKIIGAAKAKLNSSIFQKEYDATFPDDSDGFFKMSLIQSCVCPVKPSDVDEEINFDPSLHGIPSVKYVMGVDPASEKDRLAIVILECYKNHRRIVYCWSIKRTEHKERVSRGIVEENDYYRYCALKIRELMKKFNIVEIAMDAGGGGIAIEEALASPPPDLEELPIFRKKDPPDEKEPKPTDLMQGYHILDMIQFSRSEWVSNANHTLKLDFEQKTLLFPYHDQVSEEIAIEEDKQNGRVIIENNKEVRLYDSMTSLIEEIEDLKKEIVSISYSKTAKGRENWDLPKFKGPDGKFIVEAKDRYSALLMANANARAIMTIDNLPPKKERRSFGGRVSEFRTPKKDGAFYMNKPHWIKNNFEKMGRVNKR